MQQLRAVHRFVTIFLVLILLFLGVTGSLIQLTDMRSIYTRARADDVNVLAMRESFDGPGDYVVRQASDYTARALPAGADYAEMLARVISAGRTALGGVPFQYVELRMAGAMPVGQIGIGKGHARFDAENGKFLERTNVDRRDDQSPASIRNTYKHLHRMTSFGDWALIINIVVSAGLSTLIVTGTMIYLKILRQRRKMRRRALFWSAGGNWRSLHRGVSLIAAGFLTVVTLSGAWLAVESVGLAVYFRMHPPGHGAPSAPAPLADGALSSMMRVTMASLDRTAPGAAVNVIRLRSYGGYAQGVIVTGGDRSRQLVFNAQTGAAMSETEPGYPPVPFPFGWQAHQIAKSVHRGDYFGMTGRWVDLLSGLALIYLCVSGMMMYWELWRRRHRAGRKPLIWR